MPIKKQLFILLFACFQLLSVTWLIRVPFLSWITSILFLGSGFGIGILLLQISPLQVPVERMTIRKVTVTMLILGACMIASYYLAQRIMDHTPIDPKNADMLPIIRVMCNRFLEGSGSAVYDPIQDIWNGVQPIYLPALWFPFTASLVFDFDMRWITVAGIWLAVWLAIYPVWIRNSFRVLGLILVPLFALFAWFLFDRLNNVIRLTEEGVVFFYYSLMVYAIVSKKPFLIAAVSVLCLLSRYALVGWLPCLAGFYLLERQWKSFGIILLTIMLGVLLFFVIPFGWSALQELASVPGNYVEHADKVWQSNPEFFRQSPGWAKFFGPHHISLLHVILVSGSFLVPLVFLFYVRTRPNRAGMTPNFLLASFQCTITFFYAFLDVSYLYLYYTPVFVSLVMAALVLSGTGLPEKK